MIQQTKNLFKINFVKDVATLQVGKIVSMILSVAASIVFARVLKIEGYGIYGLIFSFAGILGILMSWGSIHATVTLLSKAYAQKDKIEVKNVLSYFVGLNLIKICTLGIIFYILAPWLSQLFYHNIQVGLLVRVILLANYIEIVFSMFTVVLQVSRRIKKLTLIETFKKFMISILPAGFVLIGLGLSGLVLGHFLVAVIFLLISFGIYSIYGPRDALLPSFRDIFKNISLKIIAKYFRFGFAVAINKNLGSLIAHLPIFLLGFFASLTDIGYYKVAMAYIVLPNMFLGPVSRLLNVQLPKSINYSNSIFKQHLIKTSLYSGFTMLVTSIPLVLLSSFLISFFYGAEYMGASKLVYYLISLTITSGFAVGFSPFFRTVRKMKVAIIMSFCQFALILLSAILAIYTFNVDPLMAIVVALTAVSFLFFIINWLYILKYFKKIKFT